ncbi:MAG: DNA polymerase III subunit delta' [Planctomycetales bacterium]
MNWDQLLGHQQPRDLLRRTLQRNRLAHTWLFAGPEGIGKKHFALLVAQSLFCERHPETDLDCCGACPGCRQVLAGSHPDLFVVTLPEGKRELPIELFLGPPEKRGRAGLCHDLNQTPMSGRRKIAIIDDADLLNDASANALLKTLEEPPRNSLIILVASHPEAILPTIRSRCQVLRFAPLSIEDVEKILLTEQITDDPEAARQSAALSGGSLAEATRLLDPSLRNLRTLIDRQLAAQPFNSVALTRAIQEELENSPSDASVQRNLMNWTLRFFVSFFQELLLKITGEATEFRIPEVDTLLNRVDPDQMATFDIVQEILERLMHAELDLDQNASVPLLLEVLCDDIGRLLRRLPKPSQNVPRGTF